MSSLTFSHRHRVSYAECTVGNHVYYARYLDILEETRGELFRAANLPLLQLQSEGTSFPVVECRLQYRQAARYDELLRINAHISELRAARLTIVYRVIKEPDQPVFDATICYVCASVEGKPKRLPPHLTGALRRFFAEDALQTGAPEN